MTKRATWSWAGSVLAMIVAGCGDDSSVAKDADAVDSNDVAVDSDVAPDSEVALDSDDTAVDSDDTAVDSDDIAVDIADTAVDTDVAIVTPADRAPGAREPLSARCDDADPARCFLPWPSGAFLVADASTATHVRVSVAVDAFPEDEGVEFLNGADGFSRVTPLVVSLPSGTSTGHLRLFVAEPGEAYGDEVAVESLVVAGRDAEDPPVLVGYPYAPLRPATEYLAIVERDGEPVRATAVALGLATPATQAEADRRAHFAPARSLLAAAGVDPSAIDVVWDFVTRSADDPRVPLATLRDSLVAQLDRGTATVRLTSAVPGKDAVALVVEGFIDGLEDTLPDPRGGPAVTFSVPFRVAVPTGAGDYRVVVYCHGTGGDVHEDNFDQLIAASNAAKVSGEIDGWSKDSVGSGLGSLFIPIGGTRDLTVRMRRSIAGIGVIHHALLGPLGELLAAPTVLDVPNPAAGRRAVNDRPVWAGGSLGGVIGFVYSNLEPTMAGGVLNVPGAAFTHWLARSTIGDIISLALKGRYPAMLDQQIAAAMAQTVWDEVDGAIWADARAERPIFIVQMSVGDPIMPNVGTAMVATSSGALMLLPEGAAPMVPVQGLEVASEADGRTALTEFKTNETSNNAIHGFAARNAPAGQAARKQFEDFIHSLWAGAPVIAIPDACMSLPTPGVCDFSGVTSP